MKEYNFRVFYPNKIPLLRNSSPINLIWEHNLDIVKQQKEKYLKDNKDVKFRDFVEREINNWIEELYVYNLFNYCNNFRSGVY